jgi:hydrogenase maturation protease
MADPRILVLGVGNILMGDDGVGVHAVRALADGYDLPANVRVIDGGVVGLGLLGEIAATDFLIIVDAVKCGGTPGSIYRLRQEGIHPRRGPFVSAHEVGIAELLAAAEFSACLPQTEILGVEPLETETVCLELSSPLRGALRQVVAAIVDRLRAQGAEFKRKPESETAKPEPESLDA